MTAPYGFLDYGEDDSAVNGGTSSVILKAQLTSEAEITAAGVAYGATASIVGTGSLSYSALGATGDGATGIQFDDDASNFAGLGTQGHITIWCSPDLVNDDVAYDTSGDTYVCAFGQTSFPRFRKSTSALVLDWNGVGAGSYDGSVIGRGQFVRIDISWMPNLVADLYIDKQLVYRDIDGISAVSNEGRISFLKGGATSKYMDAIAGPFYRIQVSNRPIVMGHVDHTRSIAFFGDSNTVRNEYISQSTYALTWGGQLGGSSWANEGFVNGVRKVFGAHSLHDHTRSFAKNGGTSADLDDQVTECYTTNHYVPGCAIIMMGTNDAKVVTNNISAATYKSNIDAELTNIFAAGTQKVILMKPPSITGAAGGEGGAASEALTDGYGVAIDELVAADPTRVFSVDAFTATGGHDQTDANFDADRVHLNKNGSKRVSIALNKVIETVLFT